MTTIRERIESLRSETQFAETLQAGDEWHAGNLTPADEVDARVAEALAARDAEWRGAFRSNGLTERAVELFGPRSPEEARTFIEEGEKFAVEMERERCARIADVWAKKGHHDAELIAAAIREDAHALRAEQSADAGGERGGGS